MKIYLPLPRSHEKNADPDNYLVLRTARPGEKWSLFAVTLILCSALPKHNKIRRLCLQRSTSSCALQVGKNKKRHVNCSHQPAPSAVALPIIQRDYLKCLKMSSSFVKEI